MSLKCPYCNGRLKSGQATIHGTLGGFLVFGLSYENLYFKSESEKEIKILGSNSSASALRCEDCEVVILNKEIVEPNERDNLIELLTLCTSKDLQESIKEAQPGINIQEAIIESWRIFYSQSKDELAESFTEDELKQLPEIDELLAARNWDKLEFAADKLFLMLTDS